MVVIGDAAGFPWAEQANAELFLAKYQQQYPGVQGMALPIIPSGFDPELDE